MMLFSCVFTNNYSLLLITSPIKNRDNNYVVAFYTHKDFIANNKTINSLPINNYDNLPVIFFENGMVRENL